MARNEVRKSANVSLVDATVDITVPSGETATPVLGNTTGIVNIPAGCLRLMIYPYGFYNDGDLPVAASINGQDWPVGLPYEEAAVLDENSREYKRLPAYTVNGNGGRVFYRYIS